MFLTLLPVAAVVYGVRGRGQWFYGDEWNFLSGRDGGNLHDLLRPHNEHWTTLPVIVYRLLFNVVGLDSYKPYQAISIGTHLVIAVLLRAVIRRLGVGPWVATAATVAFLFYGSGGDNVVWAFQIAFTGSIAFGLGHLLLADDEAPSPRRYLAGLACGIGSLMCSGIGLVMVVTVGVALLVGRGRRAAARNVAPLIAVFGAWRLAYGRGARPSVLAKPGAIWEFALLGLKRPVLTFGQSTAVSVAVFGVAAVGLVVAAWSARSSWSAHRQELGLLAAMAVGLASFLLISGVSRAGVLGPSYALQPRYSYIAVVFFTPVLAYGIDALARRSTYALVPLVVLLLLGVPGNIDAITFTQPQIGRAVLLAMAEDDALADVPASHLPFRGAMGADQLTVGWLRQQKAAGRIPDGAGPSPQTEAEIRNRLALMEISAPAGSEPCPSAAGERTIHLRPGKPLRFRGSLEFRLVLPDGTTSSYARLLGSHEPRAIATTGESLTLRTRGGPYAELCS